MRRDRFRPQRMRRVVIVATEPCLRDALLQVGRAGVVELDVTSATEPSTEPSSEPSTEPSGEQRDEAEELERVSCAAVRRDGMAALAGWTPEVELAALGQRLGQVGAAVVPMPQPKGAQPPTRLAGAGPGRSFDLLVQTYATVPYRDIDPTLVAGLAYVAMFGMMFGDVGHGALLLLGGVLARSGRLPGALGRSPGLRRSWLFLAGAGVSSMVFGALYGEMFGPTGLVPVLWLEPLAEPVLLLLVAVGVGAVLIAGAYGLGTVNRVREGGWGLALYARTGVAGSMLFLALGMGVAAFTTPARWLVGVAVLVAVAGLVLAFVGLLVESGGGVAGVLQAVVELVDVVVRLGSNIVSFARLAAFGLTHAALGAVVWQATTALWGPGIGALAAVVVFVVGNSITFALEALVAGIQALRLEYYELFSRVFAEEGRPFRPWRLPDPTGPADRARPPTVEVTS